MTGSGFQEGATASRTAPTDRVYPDEHDADLEGGDDEQAGGDNAGMPEMDVSPEVEEDIALVDLDQETLPTLVDCEVPSWLLGKKEVCALDPTVMLLC